METYTVTVKFTRNNPETGVREEGERSGDQEASSPEEALQLYVAKCQENEAGNDMEIVSSESVLK